MSFPLALKFRFPEAVSEAGASTWCVPKPELGNEMNENENETNLLNFPLVPKLRLGNLVLEAPASRMGLSNQPHIQRNSTSIFPNMTFKIKDSTLPTHLHAGEINSWLNLVLKGQPPGEITLTNDYERELFNIASEQGVLSLIQHFFVQSGVPSGCSSVLLKKIKRHSLASVAVEIYRQHELTGIIEKFSSSGLSFLLMKGGVLAHTLYPEPHLRERCDTDILFPDKQSAEKAWELLQEKGYQRRNTLDGEFVGYQFSCSRLMGAGLYNALDIHSKLNDYGFFANSFTFAELLQNSIPVSQLGSCARGLKHTYALMHACIHRVTNIPHGTENRLIWIYDIHLLCESFSESDWQEFCTLAAQKKIAGLSLDGLEKSEQLFATKIPEQFRLQLQDDAGKEKISPHKMNKRWQMYYFDFVSNKGLSNKIRQLKEHLFPSAQYMMNKYNFNSRMQLPYFYMLRFFSGLNKYF